MNTGVRARSGRLPSLRRLLCAFIGLVLTPACGARYEHLAERNLSSTDSLTCPGYLVWAKEPVRDVVLVINGSGTLSNAFVHPSFQEVMNTHRVAYSTYDKPGIRAPFGDPAAVTRNEALIQRYTIGHGVACATETLRWAREQFGASVRVHVRGHSEGTLVALYTYDALLESDAELAARIETFMLSGLALEPFGDILERQLTWLPDGDRLRKAFASCDWPALKDRMGISCAYVEDATRRPSGRAMFERLAVRAPAARFLIFHGSNDLNTPVEPVRALEAWNASKGHLEMEFHYYDGGHAGSEEARAEMARLFTAIVSR
jgi:pimeloyl-ACP methyl ester carboxylesterase